MEDFIIRQLAEVRLFSGIDCSDIPHMLGCIGGMDRRYSKSEYIFMEGQDVRQIGVILSGTVQMVKEDIWGGRMILTAMSGGEIFGESFVCSDQAASTVSFLAVSDCHILFLPFHRLLTTCGMACRFHQSLIENMVVMIADKNVGMMNKMEILSKKTIRERILLWASQQVQKSGSTEFTSSLGRMELAEYLCADRSALSRELKNMKEEGLIKFDRNTFQLKIK